MAKKISEQQRIGQQGVHLLGARLLSVGLSFHPNGPLDAGIDGFLELRDPETGEVRAQWITAQLKTQKEGRLDALLRTSQARSSQALQASSFQPRRRVRYVILCANRGGWARLAFF